MGARAVIVGVLVTAAVGGAALSVTTGGGAQTLNCAPAAANTMTNTVSHLCGFADTTNAGVPSGTTLYRMPEDVTGPTAATGSGWHRDGDSITVDADNAVVQNVSLSGNIEVDSFDNVTIQRVRIQRTAASEWYGVAARHTSNLTIQDSDIHGLNTGSGRMLGGIKDIYTDSTNLRVLRNNITRVSTGVQMDAGLIEGNYIHDLGQTGDDHVNGTTSNGGQGCTLLTINDNTVLNQFSQTDAISLFEDFSTQCNRVIDHNLIAGGTYCIYGGQNPGGPAAHDIAITNNQFSRMYYSTCGQFGAATAWPVNGSGGAASGNIWDDTGATVSL